MRILSGTINKIIFFIFALIISGIALHAQSLSSSPYSRYALGEINTVGTCQNFSMGSVGTVIPNSLYGPFFINPLNPASYVNSPITSFDAGVAANTTKISNTQSSTISTNTSVNYLSFLVPVNKYWGSAVGLKPYSNVGYKVTDSDVMSGPGQVDYLYEGSGGLTQFYWGNAFAPFSNRSTAFKKSIKHKQLLEEKNYKKIESINKRIKAISGLSLGANASYIFGTFENTRRVIFPDSSNAYNFRSSRTTRMNSFMLNYGMQYFITVDSMKQKSTDSTSNKNLKVERNNKIKIGTGITLKTNGPLNATKDLISYTYEKNLTLISQEEIKDTIENYAGIKGDIVLPLEMAFGLSMRYGEKWMLTAEYGMQNWSQYRFFGEDAKLKNTMNLAIGGAYTPNYKAEGKAIVFKKANYRAGFRYSQSPLEIKNTRIDEMAVSFGVGLPVVRPTRLSSQFAVLNIGVELGRRGTINNGLIEEKFAKVVLGFTLNDRWFIQPKFD